MNVSISEPQMESSMKKSEESSWVLHQFRVESLIRHNERALVKFHECVWCKPCMYSDAKSRQPKTQLINELHVWRRIRFWFSTKKIPNNWQKNCMWSKLRILTCVCVCVCYDLNRRRCKIMCIACTQIFKWINASQQKQNKQTKIEWHMSINLWFWDYDRCFFRTLWIYDSSAFGMHTSRLYCVLIGAQTMWWNYAENARNHRLDGFDRLMCTNL